MKIKRIFKIFWISLLSTMVLLFAQTLTSKGFDGFNTIRLSFIDVPLEYFIINFLVFAILTILFIIINELLPVHKLAKGVFFSAMISIVWIALKFQPSAFENFSRYIFDSFVFMIPMLIYGVFLGYLATDKRTVFKFEKKHLAYLIISVIWILFHLIYVFISGVAKEQVFDYIVWIIFASLILGLVFGLIYEFSLENKKNSFYLTSLSVFLIFISYYAYQFAINGEIDVQLIIRVALDIVSIILAIQVLEMYFNRFMVIKNNDK